MIIDQLFEDESKKKLNEVDPRNFDSDEDYYAAVNARPKTRSSLPRARGDVDSYGNDWDEEEAFRANQRRYAAAKKAQQAADHDRLATGTNESDVEEARVGNRMSDIEIGSPKIVYYKGKAVGEVGIDHEASPGNGQYYMKHYLTGKDAVGFDTKQEALAELKYIVQQMNESLEESEQLDELSWKDIQKGAKKISKGAQKFTKNVADTGAAIGGAARDVGGAIKQVGKTAIADPVSATYNATKSGLNKAANVAANTYNDVKAGAQKVGQAGATVGTDLGNAAKSVGRGVANVAGGTVGGIGAVAGGATTGLGRAAAKGFNTGVQNVGGDAVERLQTNIMKQIDAKKTEIAGLEKELAKVSSQASVPQNSVTDQGGAINPNTGKAWTPAEVADWEQANKIRGELLPKIKADIAGQGGIGQAADAMLAKSGATAPALPTATAAPGAPSKVSYGQGFAKPAAPKPTSVPNYGQKTPGYNYTTGVTPTATPAGTRVTAGGPTAAEKAALDKRIAAAAAAQPVAETVRQVKRMMETVTSKADVQRIKDYIDYHMGTNLTESAKAKRNHLISEVTQLAATRRRDIARRLAQ